jgi:SAM-dependent methyltransferase
MRTERNTAEAVAEQYYDSGDADRFYELVWGGEDIHIGLYQLGGSIFDASRRTVQEMAALPAKLGADSKVIDLGAGYGGAARYLAQQHSCHVTCLNLSRVQNARNRLLNQAEGLADKVTVLHGSYEDIPVPAASMDLVWSQDAFLHSDKRERILDEVLRVLKPGGELVFTDPMQADYCPPGALQAVYNRLNLESLASIGWYQRELNKRGFVEVGVHDHSRQLRNHYAAVRENLRDNYQRLSGDISTGYMDRMLTGLTHWVKAADAGYLTWGILHFRKSDD